MWVEDDEGQRWALPSPYVVGVLDLRSIPECAARGTEAPPHALFVLRQQDAALGGYLGEFANRDALYEPLGRAQLDAIEDRLGLARGTLAATTMADAIAEVLTHHGDPEGEARWKPLLSEEIHLGGFSVVWRGRVADDPTWRASVVGLLRADYARLKAFHRGRGSQHYRKVLGDWERRYARYGIRPQDITPDRPEPPSTTISENWDCGVFFEDLSCQLTWNQHVGDWDIVSNKASATQLGSRHQARAEADLSGADHYAQAAVVTINQPTSADNNVGPAARYDPTTTQQSNSTLYFAQALRDSGNNRTVRLGKVVSGTLTALDNPSDAWAIPTTIKVECEGSTIRAYRDGNQVASVTDSAITGHTRAGIFGFLQFQANGGASGDIELDDWEAADLGAAPQTVTPDSVVISGTAVQPTVSGTGVATATPDPAVASAALPAPTAAGSGTVTATPDAAVASAALPAPTVAPTGAAAASPDPVALSAAPAAPSVAGTGSAALTPDPAVVAASAVDPTVQSGAVVVTPGPVTMSGALPGPTVAATGATTATPDPVTATGAVPAPSVSGSGAAAASPDPVSLSGTAVAPSVTATGTATATPSPVAASVTVRTPVVSVEGGPQTVSPDPVSATAAPAAPAVSGTGSATAAPAPTVASAATPAPTVTGSGAVTVAPAAVVAATALPAPTVAAGAPTQTVTPDAVALAAAAPAPVVVAGLVLTPAPVSLAGAVVAPAVTGTGAAAATPAAVSLVAATFAPTVTRTVPDPRALVTVADAPVLNIGVSDAPSDA